MAKLGNKKESPIKELVKKSIEELANEDTEERDPTLHDIEKEFEKSRLEAPLIDLKPERLGKSKDQVIIDELLADIASKDGYFIKLKKEVRPNEFMLMKVIESEWRRWADIETAIADIVKEHTKKSPQKWGSGVYRVEIACKAGMRGKRYDPIDFVINADEEFVQSTINTVSNTPAIDPSIQTSSQLETLAQLVNVIRGVIPQGPDPSILQQAFQQGLQLKTSESTNMTTLLVGMMTAMMNAMKDMVIANKTNDITKGTVVNPEDSLQKMLSVMKDFGVLGPTTKQEKTAIDFAKELQALGLDLFKKDDPLDQVDKLKKIASIASDFMGMDQGNKPSILEKLIDVLGPAVPDMIKNVKDTFDKAVVAQQIASKNIEKMKSLPKIEQNNQNTLDNKPQEQNEMNAQVKVFFDNLYNNIKINNRMFYPIIYTSLCQDENGLGLIQGIISDQKTAKDLVGMIQQYGDDRFKDNNFVKQMMIPYINGFIVWLKQMAVVSTPQQTQQNGSMNGKANYNKSEFDVECSLCGAMYSYENEEEFNKDENKICDANGCKGTLIPLVHK